MSYIYHIIIYNIHACTIYTSWARTHLRPASNVCEASCIHDMYVCEHTYTLLLFKLKFDTRMHEVCTNMH